MNANQSKKHIILVSRDLFFFSNIQFTARSLGADASLASALSETKDASKATFVIIDLELPGLEFDELEKLNESFGLTLIGFAPHVKTELFDAARNSGITRLYTRGQLNQSSRAILSEVFSSHQ